MDWNRVEGNWKQFKGKVKEQWGKLTDDDIDQIAGKRDQLEGKIQERLSRRIVSAAMSMTGMAARLGSYRCAGGCLSGSPLRLGGYFVV